jgi:hypothetical protein
VAGRVHDPRYCPLRRQVERDGELRVHGAVECELGGTRERVLHGATGELVHDLLGVRIRSLDPREIRVLQPQFLQRALVRAACCDLDPASRRLADRGRARAAAPVDQVLADQLVAWAELRIRGQLDPGRQSGGRQVRPPRPDLVDGVFPGPDRVEPQRHAEVLGESAGQLVGWTFRAMAAEVVGVRAVASRDAQFAAGQDLLEQGRRLRAGAEQQDRYQCEQGFQGLYRIRGPRRGTEAVITAPTRNRMGA